MADGRRWEFIAIPMALIGLGAIAILAVAADAGLWAWLLIGAVGLVIFCVLAWYAITRRPQAPAPETLPAAPQDGSYRLLVIADGVCAASDLDPVLAAADGASRTVAHVVAPAVGSRTARMTGDEQAYAEASARLQAVLEVLRGRDVEADGRVGSHDPLQAVEDGFREFPAHRILFLVRERTAEHRLEHGVVDMARERFPVPCTAVAARADPG